jgi:hypothetical protein
LHTQLFLFIAFNVIAHIIALTRFHVYSAEEYSHFMKLLYSFFLYNSLGYLLLYITRLKTDDKLDRVMRVGLSVFTMVAVVMTAVTAALIASQVSSGVEVNVGFVRQITCSLYLVFIMFVCIVYGIKSDSKWFQTLYILIFVNTLFTLFFEFDIQNEVVVLLGTSSIAVQTWLIGNLFNGEKKE